MMKASDLKTLGFSLGFGMCNPLRAESCVLKASSLNPSGVLSARIGARSETPG